MTINFTTLFTNLGKAFYVQELINTARGTTIQPEVLDFLDQYTGVTLEFTQAVSSVEPANRSMKNGMDSLMSALRAATSNVIIETVDADATLDQRNLTNALVELIRQMVANNEDVDASTTTASGSGITGNGDGVLVFSAKRADGKNCENALSEVLYCECTADTTPETATFTIRGESRVDDRLSSDWPGGSGIIRSIQAIDADNSLLTNGTFEDEETVANAPDGWIVSVGTVGTTLLLTNVEVQEIVVTGPPTAGTYTISITNAASKVQTTTPLAFDASGSDVQAAINELIGFEDVEVTTTGTSPLFTHTITFTGIAGNLSTLAVTNSTTGGTYTPAQVTAGSANSYIGKALEFDSDGSQLTTIQCPVELEPLKQYAFNCWMKADVVPAAGVITIDLVDGIGGSVIADEAATNNSFTQTCSALSTSFVSKTGTFRTPRVLPPIVYLRIRISTGVSSGSSIFIDHAALEEMTELYPGGPSLAIFSGAADFRKGAGQVVGDWFNMTVANDRAGEFQEWFDRNFDMRSKGLLLPSVTDASETQADTLIA